MGWRRDGGAAPKVGSHPAVAVKRTREKERVSTLCWSTDGVKSTLNRRLQRWKTKVTTTQRDHHRGILFFFFSVFLCLAVERLFGVVWRRYKRQKWSIHCLIKGGTRDCGDSGGWGMQQQQRAPRKVQQLYATRPVESRLNNKRAGSSMCDELIQGPQMPMTLRHLRCSHSLRLHFFFK